jgi:hypothetical protein
VPTPQQRTSRATRKSVLYGYLRRWYEPGLGLDPFEWLELERQGFGRWLVRDRLTADMVVALILYTLDVLDGDAEDRLIHPAQEREQMMELLRMRVHSPTGDQPAELRDEERRCLAALEKLDKIVVDHGGPIFRIRDEDGTVEPAPEPERIANAWRATRSRFRSTIDSLGGQVATARDTTEKLRLGPRRRDPVIHLGDRAAARAKALRLRADVGPRFLDPEAMPSYRAACVRKWKQLAFRG